MIIALTQVWSQRQIKDKYLTNLETKPVIHSQINYLSTLDQEWDYVTNFTPICKRFVLRIIKILFAFE